MRRILILATIVLVAVSAFAQVVVYEDTALLEWDGIIVDADGSALLPGDVVSYDVYIYDYSVTLLCAISTKTGITLLETITRATFDGTLIWAMLATEAMRIGRLGIVRQ